MGNSHSHVAGSEVNLQLVMVIPFLLAVVLYLVPLLYLIGNLKNNGQKYEVFCGWWVLLFCVNGHHRTTSGACS